MKVKACARIAGAKNLTHLQVIDNGSVPVSNAEALAHIIYLQDKYRAEGRERHIPDSVQKALRNVSADEI